ncbi:MAG: ferredoxin family protein [Burkholderiaceae bacterium]|nr:ferredoxin family protein [Burkholderiaceae bacterium]
MTGSPPGLQPDIAVSRCTGCGRCVAVCPDHVLWLEVDAGRKHARLHTPAACSGCRRCAPACPFGAIRMRRVAAAAAQESPDASTGSGR